jgi:flagellar basal-body rod modification protein FlgD
MTMQIAAALQALKTQSAATGNAPATTSSSSSSTDLSSMFMQLLIAELKSQNPTSPQDPTQFVGQLVQFNSLSELEKIRALLQAPITTTPAPPAGGGVMAPATGGH